MPLNESMCRKALPREKAYKLSDGEGLYLLVQPNGSRYWRMNYREAGKQKTSAFGCYPEVSLADARLRLDKEKDRLRNGIPASARGGDTFEEVAREWYERQKGGWVVEHQDRVLSRLERDLFPAMGKMPIDQIEAPTLLEAIRQIEARGAQDVARRSLQHASCIFRYGVASGRKCRDVGADLKGALRAAPKVKHMAALGTKDLGEFFLRLRDYDGEEQVRLAIELVMHTFVRTNELRFGLWSEIEDDLWRIPGERMKAGRDHIVPLSKQSLALLARLRELAGKSEWIVPGKPGKPISQNTMIFALYRLGYHSRATMHGFRRTASTVLNESGHFEPDWIERQLAHVPGNKVRAAYNAAEYLKHRKLMMDWWSRYLDREAGMAQLFS